MSSGQIDTILEPGDSVCEAWGEGDRETLNFTWYVFSSVIKGITIVPAS